MRLRQYKNYENLGFPRKGLEKVCALSHYFYVIGDLGSEGVWPSNVGLILHDWLEWVGGHMDGRWLRRFLFSHPKFMRFSWKMNEWFVMVEFTKTKIAILRVYVGLELLMLVLLSFLSHSIVWGLEILFVLNWFIVKWVTNFLGGSPYSHTFSLWWPLFSHELDSYPIWTHFETHPLSD